VFEALRRRYTVRPLRRQHLYLHLRLHHISYSLQCFLYALLHLVRTDHYVRCLHSRLAVAWMTWYAINDGEPECMAQMRQQVLYTRALWRRVARERV